MRGSKRARRTPAPPHLLSLPGTAVAGGGGDRRRTGGDAANRRRPGAGRVAGRGRRARAWRGGAGGKWKRGNRSLRAPLARALAGAGLAVLLFDYRGYGGNPGRPSEQGLARDVRAAHRFLIDEAEVAPTRLLYFGESLGAAVVSELASEHPPAGLVLRSPFVDLASVGRVHYPFLPVRTLLRDRYPLADQLAGVKVPTTVATRSCRRSKAARSRQWRPGDAGRGDRGRRPQRPRPAREGAADQGGRRACRAGLRTSPNQACSRHASAITAAGVTGA
jgi:pimeloyl-ACP methyl ester carboxylesterase